MATSRSPPRRSPRRRVSRSPPRRSYSREESSHRHRHGDRYFREDRYDQQDRGDRYRRDAPGGGEARSGHGRHNDSPIVLFDKYCIENLSPYKGLAPPLEERQRILRNWDAAPPGFERISAEKAKLTGLFPPPGNIAKIADFVPPVLDATKAAMLAMLSSGGPSVEGAAAVPHSAIPSLAIAAASGAMLSPAMSKQARRVYVGNIPRTACEDDLVAFFTEHMTSLQESLLAAAAAADGSLSHVDLLTGNDGRSPTVIGVEISADRDYAFVDFKSNEEAALATKLDQMPFMDSGLAINVRRTREYQMARSAVPGGAPATSPTTVKLAKGGQPTTILSPTASMLLPEAGQVEASEKHRLVMMGLPAAFQEAHLKYLMAPFGLVRYFRLLSPPSSAAPLQQGLTEGSAPVEEGEEARPSAGEEDDRSILIFELDDHNLVDPVKSALNGLALDGTYTLTVKRLSECEDEANIANILSLHALTPGRATCEPTPVIQMLNMVSEEDLADEAIYSEIFGDIKSECEAFGAIQRILIPRPEPASRTASVPFVGGVGKVFVHFEATESAMRAMGAIAGRSFADRTIIASYYPMEKFQRNIL